MNSWIDFKYACRLLANRPGFAVVTVLIMALGIGLCIYNYSFIYSIALKKLPFPGAERMVLVSLRVEGNNIWSFDPHRLESFRELSKQARSFDHLGFFQGITANVSGGDYAVRYYAAAVKPDMFEFTSTYPLLGRPFTAADTVENARPVTVISYSTWQNYLGGMNDVLGHQISVNGVDTEIIGVMPEGFAFPYFHDLWLPSTVDLEQIDNEDRKIRVTVYGMLKPGVSVSDANAEAINIYRRLALHNPEDFQNQEPVLQTFQLAFLGGGTEEILITMSIAVIFVLLLASVNVANLLYARAAERAKETAIRSALGAPNGRLIMQMMWESLIICAIGGVFALLMAQVGLEISAGIMAAVTGGDVPYFWTFSINPHILLVSLILILVTAVITGILPAWKIIAGDFNQVLRDGTQGAQGRNAGRINRGLVILEVALSCILLTVSAMIAVATYQARHSDYGFETGNILTAQIGLPEASYPTPESQTLFFESLLDNLNQQPGIEAAFMSNPLPGKGAYYRPIEVDGFEKNADNHYPKSNSAEMSTGAMEALGIDLLEGRYFDARDTADSMPVAIVTRSFIDRVLPEADRVIGKRIRFAADDNAEQYPWMTIVGVVNHVIQSQPYLPGKLNPTIYTPMAQNQWRFTSLMIRGHKDPMAMVPVMNTSLSVLDKDVPAYYIQSLEDSLKMNTAGMDFVSGVFNLFAIVALVLASTGIYAVIANAVQRRTHELGLRRALGATDAQVVTMLMRQGWRQLLIGVVIGLPIAYMMGNMVISFLVENDPIVYAMLVVMPVLIGIVVTLATRIPAQRAVVLEPSAALHYE